RLLTVIRNMGSDGATPGDAIDLVERGVKDALDRGWHKADKSKVVDEYVFDDRAPVDFYVSPPTDDTTDVYIELSQAIVPATVKSLHTIKSPTSDGFSGRSLKVKSSTVNSWSAALNLALVVLTVVK
ncbi:hypothetical protein LCGC14_2014610, partial [marine sediment metagenome]